MIRKPLDSITADDIRALVDDQVHEGKTLEYKARLYSLGRPRDEEGQRQRQEALRDVSSIANAEGGDVVFGISDAVELVGIDDPGQQEDVGRFINHLTQALDSQVTPRIGGIRHLVIDCGDGKRVVVLRIPKSPAAPHMVGQQTESFWLRGPNGKRTLDVRELRTAFTASIALEERIRSERVRRIAILEGGEEALPIKGPSFVVLHIYPLATFSGSGATLGSQEIANLRQVLEPLHSGEIGSVGRTLNFNGIRATQYTQGGTAQAYTQVFRSGAIEVVENTYFHEGRNGKIFYDGYESEILKAGKMYLDLLQRELDVPPPYVLMLSLLNVAGYHLPPDYGRVPGHEIEETRLLLPDIEIEEWPAELATELRPIFDIVWQAMGIERSRNYDDQGNWVARGR